MLHSNRGLGTVNVMISIVVTKAKRDIFVLNYLSGAIYTVAQ